MLFSAAPRSLLLLQLYSNQSRVMSDASSPPRSPTGTGTSTSQRGQTRSIGWLSWLGAACALGICPILDGLCTCSLWSSVAIAWDTAGFDLAHLGWASGVMLGARIPMSCLVSKYELRAAVPMLLTIVLSSLAGFVWWDTQPGMLLTIFSAVTLSQRPVQQVVVRSMYTNDAELLRATKVYVALALGCNVAKVPRPSPTPIPV